MACLLRFCLYIGPFLKFRYYTGYPKDLGPSRVIHFTSERQFVQLLHEGSPVVVAFTIRCFSLCHQQVLLGWLIFLNYILRTKYYCLLASSDIFSTVINPVQNLVLNRFFIITFLKLIRMEYK